MFPSCRTQGLASLGSSLGRCPCVFIFAKMPCMTDGGAGKTRGGAACFAKVVSCPIFLVVCVLKVRSSGVGLQLCQSCAAMRRCLAGFV
jgi:hypothetical protein